MKKIAVAVLALLVTSCGIIDKIRGKDDELELLKPNPLPDITREVSLDRSWSFGIGGQQAGLRPALGASTVYVANNRGGVAAVGLESGRVEWRESLDVSVSGGVGTGEGLVMVGGLDGEVVALDRRDGSEAWRSRVGSEVIAPPRAASGVVVVRTIDGGVAGLSTTSGEPQWSLTRDEPSLTLRGASPPLLDQGVAVLGFADGYLVAVEAADGAILWEVPVSRPSGTNEVDRMIDVDAEPLRLGDVLYAVSFQGSLAAYALGANQTKWTKEVSSHTDIAADAGTVYVSDSLGRVHALSAETGEAIWVQDQLLRRRLSGPAIAGDYIVVGDYEGYLHVLNRSDGRLVGRRDLGDQIAVQPLVRGGRIFVLTEAGRLSAVTISADEG